MWFGHSHSALVGMVFLGTGSRVGITRELVLEVAGNCAASCSDFDNVLIRSSLLAGRRI